MQELGGVIAAVPPPPDPPFAADERETLVTFLDYYRSVLLRKAAGLTRAELALTRPPSDMSLGGLVKHMALVENNWFVRNWRGQDPGEPWTSVDWDADPDWDFHSAADDEPHQLLALYTDAIERSRQAIDGCDDLSATVESRGRVISLRWMLVHMIEEYARHCGHADMLRQSIDGAVGD
jgi:uncharacterized damage-inducible protein DinB